MYACCANVALGFRFFTDFVSDKGIKPTQQDQNGGMGRIREAMHMLDTNEIITTTKFFN